MAIVNLKKIPSRSNANV